MLLRVAGTLSMLPAVVGVASRAGWASLAYVAVESDARLVDAAALELQTSRGYRVDAPTDAREDADPTKRLVGAGPNGMEVHLTLITADAFSFVQSGAPPHLLVACAFADLVPPELLLTRFRRLAPGTTTPPRCAAMRLSRSVAVPSVTPARRTRVPAHHVHGVDGA